MAKDLSLTIVNPSKLPPSQTLYLIDISSFIFRAFFAIRNLRNRAGEPTNAVFGVATMLARLAEEAKPEYLAVVYDSKEPSFRKEIYSEYKANRSAPPDDLVPQFARIEELIRAFEIHSYRQSGIEADDLIATLTRRWSEVSPEHRVVIVTGDKDLMQMVNDQVSIWDTMSNRRYGSAEVIEKFGVRPDQIRDYLALVGDSSDNIPGVSGIGPKGAVDLLRDYLTLPEILSAAKAGKIPGKKGLTLVASEADAVLSAELATVREDLDVKIPLESLRYQFHVKEDCIRLLKELDFHTLVTRWAAKVPAVPETTELARVEAGIEAVADHRFRTVNQESALTTLLSELDRAKEFGFDLETTSLNPREAEIVGIALCSDPERAHYIPVGHRGDSTPQLPKALVLEKLKPFLENPKYKKIGQNLKYDWSILRSQGFRPDGIGSDTMIAAYLLDPDGRHNLQALSAKYLDYNVMTYEEVCGKGKDQLCFDQIPVDLATRYSAEDAWVSVKLWQKLKGLVESEGLMPIFAEVDLPLVQILSKMELQGVCIDVPWLAKLSEEFNQDLARIEDRIQAYTSKPVNLNSPKQLAQLLFEDLKLPPQGKTKTGFSTDAQVLDLLSPLHEVPRLLMEYREISKLKGTYVDPLPLLKDPRTGKIHASFHQTVAATGRLSSTDPNLQNIPIRSQRGMRIRRAFIPSQGNVLLSADYSQIELRLLADMSQDPELLRSFRTNEDVHRRTASEIFGVAPDAVDDRQRGIAKAINFGLMYGKSAFGLSQELKIPRKEAQEMIQRYFERYHSVKVFLDHQIEQAKERGYVTSLMGRKRRLPDIQSRNHALRSNAERMAMNTPLQSTAADLMKLAMIEVDQRLEKEGLESKLIIQVHDELVLDCPKNEVEKVRKLVCESMESAMGAATKISVPLQVNTSIGENWMDL